MQLLPVALAACIAASAAAADQNPLYCVEEMSAGIANDGERFFLQGNENQSEPRYTVIFNDDYSAATGIGGTKTQYRCGRGFPNKAPDVVTCHNTLVVSMMFNYSIDTGRFAFIMTGPGGWLSVGTDREGMPLTDHIAVGRCQAF